MACAFVDSFFEIALMSYMLYSNFTSTAVTVCPVHNPMDFHHFNQTAVEHEKTGSVSFYGFTAISLLIFFLFFLLDAIAGENTMQLIVSMVTSVIVSFYTVYKSVHFEGLNYA